MRYCIDARTELGEGKRREVYVDMRKIVHHEGGVVPMFANYGSAMIGEVEHEDNIAAS